MKKFFLAVAAWLAKPFIPEKPTVIEPDHSAAIANQAAEIAALRERLVELQDELATANAALKSANAGNKTLQDFIAARYTPDKTLTPPPKIVKPYLTMALLALSLCARGAFPPPFIHNILDTNDIAAGSGITISAVGGVATIVSTGGSGGTNYFFVDANGNVTTLSNLYFLNATFGNVVFTNWSFVNGLTTNVALLAPGPVTNTLQFYGGILTNVVGGQVSCTAPTISVQPANVTCITNTTTNFTVTASGTGLTYQWETNGVNVANGTQFSGATTASLTASNVVIAQSNTLFDCKIVGTCGSITSSVATLTVTNGTGGGSFNPSNRAPMIWFSADYAVTNSSGVVAANNDPVQFMGDKSGNANVINDPNFTYTFKTAQQNGLPAIDTGANGGSLSRSVFQQGTISQPFTLYVAAKHTTSASYKALFTCFSGGNEFFGIDDASHGTAFAPTGLTSASTVSAGWHVFAYVVDGASSLIRVDGSQIAAGDVGSSTLVGMRVGNRSDNDLRWNSQIGEIIMVTGHDNSTQLSDMEGYLARWQ
jgi:hypothetical protein